MADPKEPDATDEPFMDLEDIAEGVEKGEIELPTRREATPDDLYTPENFDKFIMGEITWAQLHGMTMAETYNIAEYGYGLYQEGKYHDARKVFEGLVICNPYDGYFHNMLGAVYQQLDMREEAAEEYTLAIELDDENIHAHVNRGELLLLNGEFEKALDDLKRAIALDPDGRDSAGLRARALAMATANAMDEVRKIYQEHEQASQPESSAKPTPKEGTKTVKKASAKTADKTK